MSKVKVTIEHGDTKKEFECDFIIFSASNSDIPRLATKSGVIGKGHLFDMNRAYVALGTAIHTANVQKIYGKEQEEARELVKDLIPEVRERAMSKEVCKVCAWRNGDVPNVCKACDGIANFTQIKKVEPLIKKLNEYQQLAERTAGKKDQRERFCNFGLGIAGEAGEVTDYLKKVLFHGHELDKDKLCKELGDVMWYVATIATTAGLTLEEVARKNIDKLRERYPEGFDQERSINRDE